MTPSSNYSDLDLRLLAHLLDATVELAPHRDLEGLAGALFRVIQAHAPVAWLGLWLAGATPEEAPETWCGTFSPEGLLLPDEAPPDWITWTGRIQGPCWHLASSTCQRADLRGWFEGRGWQSSVVVPLRTFDGLKGGLALATPETGAYTRLGQGYLTFLGRMLGSFMDKLQRLRHLDRLNAQLARERREDQLLLELNNELMRHLEPQDFFQAIAPTLRQHLHCDAANLMLVDEESRAIRVAAVDFPSSRGFMTPNRIVSDRTSPAWRAMEAGRPVVYHKEDLLASSPSVVETLLTGEGLLSGCCLPLVSRGRVLGSVNLGSRRERAFEPEDLPLLGKVASQVALALDNALAYERLQHLSAKLEQEKVYLEEEVAQDFALEEIIGHSPAIRHVLTQARIVAPSDATVLLMGETGTGKELVARAIHNLSGRKDRTFVKLNCAAIPLGLLESELFGHEKGAFTGAIARKVGRMELAHQGTLFLDEVGELPLELQPKLLRAIQEREFERLGGTHTQQVDVRLVAATNRDLSAMVAAGTFRSDLFYRLNVFPLRLPPLRERREDIPLLVRYFTQKYAQRMGRRIETIPTQAMEALVTWSWPGNIRELENLVERSVILSPGPDLQVPLSALLESAPAPTVPEHTLADAERTAIERALAASGGRVGGPEGAAARLGMKRTTLQSRMKKLGLA